MGNCRHGVRPGKGDGTVTKGTPLTSAGYDRPAMRTSEQRREELKAVYTRAQSCPRCPPLAATRTTVVFGAGHADAELMFIGEAPGRHEDEQGRPFVGQAGALLTSLLEEIGLTREEVFIQNVLMCRPPGNRDPQPQEIANCQEYLYAKLELVEPKVVCTLGNYSTKLLRGDPTPVTRLHGRPEVRFIGPRMVRLYPLLHPAAALYTPAQLDTLRADFARIPELLALAAPPQPEIVLPPEPVAAPAAVPGEPAPPTDPPTGDPSQLGLF